MPKNKGTISIKRQPGYRYSIEKKYRPDQLYSQEIFGSKAEKLFALGKYFSEQLNEVVDNKIDKPAILPTERNRIVESLLEKLGKAVVGTAYEGVPMRDKTTLYIDRLFLDKSEKDANKSIQSLKKTLEQLYKAPASPAQAMNLKMMQIRNPNWKMVYLKGVMDHMGISPSAGVEIK